MTWEPLYQTEPYRNGVPIELPEGETQWSNNLYVVNRAEREHNVAGNLPMIHLSIRNIDRSTRHDWRDFQRIKNQLAGPDYEGLEVYPPEDKLIDTANQYHIFCLPFSINIGFNEGRKVSRMAQTEILQPGAVQRDPEEIDLKYGGLTRMKELKEWLHSEPTEPTIPSPVSSPASTLT